MAAELNAYEHEWNRVLERLDQAGVPRDLRWRTLILYMRNVKGFYFLTEEQKAQLQTLIADCMRSKDFTEERYAEVVKRHEEILLGPLMERYRSALDETESLLQDFNSLLKRKKGDVQRLEVVSVDTVRRGGSPKEMISTMRKAFHEVVHAMEVDMDNLARMSLTDELTQLNNRRALDGHLDACVGRAVDKGGPLGFILLDIDNFKNFNDTYGHLVGDQALRVVAKVLKLCGQEVNTSFSPDTYYPARYGGEEFVIVIEGLDKEQALDVAQTVRRRLERYNFTIQDTDGNVIHEGIRITASLGVAMLDPAWKGALVGNLVESADRNLYKAKEQGRNQVVG